MVNNVVKQTDLLVEIGTEELPPKALQRLSNAFSQGVVDALVKAGFEAGSSHSYATPRRLAVLIKDVGNSQPERNVERKGPSLDAAFDADGKPTKAVEGFARSCGVEVSELEQLASEKGVWLVYRVSEKGKLLKELLLDIVNSAIEKLPVPKRMRWGAGSAEFVRPVHWVVLMHGKEIIKSEILGIATSGKTRGHRFHANRDIKIPSADKYASCLERDGFVIADLDERKTKIRQMVNDEAIILKGKAVIDDDLLDEVVALVEWPVAVVGEFESEYLSVPSEALIKTMQDNQKYFPVVDKDGKLKNCFITISNIDSKNPKTVKEGNERVIRPRLADARFFWEQDQKQSLESFGPNLDSVVFQEKLGSIGDKTRRVISLAEKIASELGANIHYARRAALLAKCDLLTNMVGEFATLQGVMGRRYAQVDGEAEEVALAIDEQYMPRGAGGQTPTTQTGQILAICDRLDTLVGIFAIGQRPGGEKDPYALRRAALGILRIIIESELELDLNVLIKTAAAQYPDAIKAEAVCEDVFGFMLERLKAYYLDNGVLVDVFDAVSVLKPSRPLDFDKRIKAVGTFRLLPEASSLAAANKRVGNILKKSGAGAHDIIDINLLTEEAEIGLFNELSVLKSTVEPLFDSGNYEDALCKLSSLKEPVDTFFDSVMVMADDEAVRNNRIALLNSMSAMFLRAADLSRLHKA